MQTLNIGREANNQIVLNDNMVSRNHAQLLILDNGQVMLKDLNSSNGTFVNGNRITECYLITGDVVKCGTSFLNWVQYVNSHATSSLSNDNNKINLASEIQATNNYKNTIDVSSLKHEKEKTYFTVKLIFSCIIWLIIICIFIVPTILCSFIDFRIFTGVSVWFLLSTLIAIGFAALVIWLTGLYFKAVVYGNSVKVNANQYPEIHRISVGHSARLGLANTPDIFICNSDGVVNAIAISFLSKRYILLMSSLVDLMLISGKYDEISMIIGHEIGHHAAGHNNFWKNLLLRPASIIPFLEKAYHRACELTADRIGLVLTNNLDAAQNALYLLALGSQKLSQNSNIAEFMHQENDIPGFMGFLHKIFSSYPRITKRVIELKSYNNMK